MPVQKFNWDRWLAFYGLCFLVLHLFGVVTPVVYCGLSLVLLCTQGVVSNFRREKRQQIQQAKLALQNMATYRRDAVVTGADTFLGWSTPGELDNSGFFEALKRHKDKCREDEELRRAFCESCRIEAESGRLSPMNEMARTGLTREYGGVLAEHAMRGLSDIKQSGLSTQQSNALSASCRSHYEFMNRR